MKKFRSLFILIMAIVLPMVVFSLSACGSNNAPKDTRQVPVYQGMSITSATTDRTVESFTDPNNGNDNNGNHYGWYMGDHKDKDENLDNDHPFEDNGSDENIETEINGSLEIIGTDKEIYYASVNEDVYINVHISNPDNFEILSFTLNNQKYSSYMFEQGSDMETIVLKYNVGKDSGIFDYTIDAIKYIDGEKIKDVIIGGEQTIKAGVRRENQVAVNVSNLAISANEFSFDVNIEDKDELIAFSNGSLSAVLYDGNNLIATQKLSLGINSVKFENLATNSVYQYAIVGSYDDLVEGVRLNVLYKEALYTKSIVLFKDIVVEQESIKFDFEWDNEFPDKTISAITLLKDGETLRNIAVTDKEIGGLLSANEYSLVAEYSNKGNKESISIQFTTKDKIVPVIVIENVVADSEVVEFAVNCVDVDGVIKTSKTTLYRAGVEVESFNGFAAKFENLLSNNEYTVKVEVVYDLNDGNGEVGLAEEATFTTVAKKIPYIDVTKKQIEKDGFSFEITESDSDNVGNVSKIAVLRDGNEDVLLNVEDRIASGLLSNTEYILKVTYTYDLNDGKGEQTIEKELEVTTAKKTVPSIDVQLAETTSESVKFVVTETDTDEVGAISKIELLQADNVIKQAESAEVRIFAGLLSDNAYVIKLTYSYDLNDGKGEQTIVKELEVTTAKKTVPSIDLQLAETTSESVKFVVTETDTDGVGAISKIELLQADNVIKQAENTEVRIFDDLLSDNTYVVKVTYIYDLNDGKGEQTIVKELEVTTAKKTVPSIDVQLAETTSESVKFVVTETDTDEVGAISKIELLHGTDTPIIAGNINVRAFEKLLSDSAYAIKVTYEYDLNDGKGVQTVEKKINFTTVEKSYPQIKAQIVDYTKTSVEFTVNETDTDDVGYIKKIELLHEGDNPVVAENADVRSFDGLLSNNEYTIRILYVYDLNDGNGEQKIERDLNFITLENIQPSFKAELLEIGQSSVKFIISETDIDKVGEISKIELLHSEKTIVAENTEARSFDGLLSDNDYVLRVTYAYNLNDGQGKKITEKTLTFHTLKKKTPVLEVQVAEITNGSIKFTVTETDTDEVGSISKIELLHGNDEPVIAESTEARSFEGLLSDNTYTVKVTYTYDLNDGKGAQTVTKQFEAVTAKKKLPTVELQSAESTVSSVKFVINVTDVDEVGTISKIELLHGNDSPIVAPNVSIRVFEGLLSDNAYTVKVTYTYNLNDGKGEQYIVKELEVATAKKKIPVLELQLAETTSESVKFVINETDVDEVGNVAKIEMLRDGTVVATAQSTNDRIFEDLLSDNAYVVKVTYTYDLNDGKGVQSIIRELNAKTAKKVTPSFELQLAETTSGSIKFVINETDVDEVGNVAKIEIMRDGTVVATAQSTNDRIFEDLLSDNAYVVKVTYEYDLNDGKGVQTTFKELEAKTAKKTTPVLELQLAETTSGSIKFVVTEVDTDEVGAVIKIELLHGSDAPIVAPNTLTRTFDGLLSDNTYTVKATYTYDLNDGKGVRTIVKELEARTAKNAIPVLDLSVVSTTKTTVKFDIVEDDIDSVGAIAKIELEHAGSDPIVLSDNTLRIFENLLSNNAYTVKVTYEYDLNDGTGVKQIVKTAECKTLAKVVPTVSVTKTNVTQSSITFSVKVTDTDKIATIKAIKLLKGGEVVQTAETVDVREFADLLSNTSYDVVVEYVYDLNDGKGVITKTSAVAISTLSYIVPTLTVNEAESVFEYDNIQLKHVLTDKDSKAISYSVELYDKTELIFKTDNALSTEFDGLKCGYDYTVKTIVKYNLNDGKGDQFNTITTTVTTPYYIDSYGVWYQVKSDDTVSVVGYNKGITDIEIADYVCGYPVTYIGVSVFSECKTLSTVKLPSTLKSIGYHAFSGCINLYNIELNEGLEEIGQNAFNGCMALDNVTTPTTLQKICVAAFSGCTSLKNLELKEGLINIQSSAFSGCTSLRRIIVPYSVASVEEGGLRVDLYSNENTKIYVKRLNVNGLWHTKYAEDYSEGFTYGQSTLFNFKEFISDENFVYALLNDGTVEVDECLTGSKEITIPETINGYTVVSVGFKCFANKAITSVQLPDTVKYIKYQAFYYTGDIRSINMPTSLATVESMAFYGAINMRALKFNSLPNIDSYAFANCRIKSLDWPQVIPSDFEYSWDYEATLTGYLSGYAFAYNQSLLYVSLPANYSYIESDVFYDCPNFMIASLAERRSESWNEHFAGTAPTVYWNSYLDEQGVLYEINNTILYEEKATITVRDYFGTDSEVLVLDEVCGRIVWMLGEEAFWDTPADSPIYSSKVQMIAERAVPSGYTNLYPRYDFISDDFACKIVNNTIEIIGYVGQDRDVIIPDEIDGYPVVKAEMGLLKKNFFEPDLDGNIDFTPPYNTVTVSSNLMSIIFYEGWGSNLPGKMNYYKGGYYLASKDNEYYALIKVDNASEFEPHPQTALLLTYVHSSSITIPDSVKAIGDRTFYGSTAISTITFGENSQLKSIGEDAFYNSYLASINLPDSLLSIGDYAFSNCSKLTSISLPDNLISIGEDAFWSCVNLRSIEIPLSVTSVGEDAFSACKNLVIYCEAKTKPSGWSSSWKYLGTITVDGVWVSENCPVIWDCKNNNIADDGYIYGITIDGINYAIKGTNAKVIRTNISGEVIIPSTITYNTQTYKVTSIGREAFFNCMSLTSIVIPDSITSIESLAFSSCYNLTIYCQASSKPSGWKSNWNNSSCPVVWDYKNNNVAEDGYVYGITVDGLNYAIKDNEAVVVGLNTIGDVVIPNVITYNSQTYSVTSIGANAFYRCSSPTSIEIPDSITSIGSSAFYGCNSLTSITIPFVGATKDGTENTRFNYIFGGSVPTSLKTVIITGGTSIGEDAFYGCSNLASIEIPASVTSIGGNAFYNCSNLTSIVIPDSVTSIGNFAFYNCSNLTSIEIPDSVTSIGEYAFYGCSSLTSVVIGNSVISIGNSAFRGCSSLTSVVIGNSVTSIGKYAFYDCRSLTSIEIPDSVTSIGEDAFSKCISLTSVYYKGSIDQWVEIEFFGSSSNPLSNAENLYIKGKLVTEVKLTTATKINDYAFYDYRNLTSIEIPNSVTSIGKSAFLGCSGLTSIEIPASVTSIGNFAFYNCSNLTSIEVPDSVTSIGSSAFSGCSSLTNIEIPASVTSIGGNAFYNCSKLTSIEIPDSVTSIGGWAFSGCSSLTSIEIPNSVTSIGSYAFYSCNKLTIYCEVASKPSGWDGTWNISYRPVVWNCKNSNVAEDGYVYGIIIDGINYAIKDSTAKVAAGTNARGDLVIPSSIIYNSTMYKVTSIGNGAFNGCSSLTSITIPDSVTSVGDRAFSDCSSLTSIKISNRVSSIGNYAFSGCYHLTIYCEAKSKPGGWKNDWNISYRPVVWDCNNNNIATDGYEYGISVDGIEYAIRWSTAKVVRTSIDGDIVIPSTITYNSKTYTVTSIGEYAFYDCDTLTSIKLSNTVTSIGDNAFYGCNSLTSIILSDSLTSIGEYAFCDCNSLTNIILPNSLTSIGTYAFQVCNSLTSIIIPQSVTYIEYYAFNGKYPIYLESSAIHNGWHPKWNIGIKEYFYSETQPTADGNYWHYVDGEAVSW